MLSGKKVLVTGAAGFIGSHLVETLVKRGAEVTCITHYNSAGTWGNLEFLDADVKRNLVVAGGNVEDSDFVLRVMADKDVVLHLAALIGIPFSYLAPRSYVRTNMEGTLNVLEAARRIGVPRIVHTSTSEVYGTAVRSPMDEDHPLQAQSPYSATKIAADKIAESYFRSFGTPVVILRPFNTFGPRQTARAVIPTIITQALERDAVYLGSLKPERDMTFIADTVEGFIAAAVTPRIEGETINLGTNQTFSIGSLAERILRLMGCTKPIRHEPSRDRPLHSEVLRLISDNSKAKRLLDWTPRVPIDEGLTQTITFVNKYRHHYRPNLYAV